MHRTLFPLLLAAATSAAVSTNSSAESSLWLTPTCGTVDAVSLKVTFLDDPQNPSPLPAAWVGYDIYRRALPGCTGLGQRVNDEILVRPPTGVHELTYIDTPSPGSYQYTAVFVDANREPVFIPSCYYCDVGIGM